MSRGMLQIKANKPAPILDMVSFCTKLFKSRMYRNN